MLKKVFYFIMPIIKLIKDIFSIQDIFNTSKRNKFILLVLKIYIFVLLNIK